MRKLEEIRNMIKKLEKMKKATEPGMVITKEMSREYGVILEMVIEKFKNNMNTKIQSTPI